MKKEPYNAQKSCISPTLFRKLGKKKKLSREEMKVFIRQTIHNDYLSMTAASNDWGVSKEYVRQVVNDERPASKSIAKRYGYTQWKIIIYIKDDVNA